VQTADEKFKGMFIAEVNMTGGATSMGQRRVTSYRELNEFGSKHVPTATCQHNADQWVYFADGSHMGMKELREFKSRVSARKSR